MAMKSYKSVDQHIESFSGETRKKLEQIRKTIKEAVPEDTEERISYGIPTYTWHGNLLHFSGYETHIGFYPGSGPIKQFASELTDYKTGKGTIQFPLDKPLPIELIKQIIKACIERNLVKKK